MAVLCRLSYSSSGLDDSNDLGTYPCEHMDMRHASLLLAACLALAGCTGAETLPTGTLRIQSQNGDVELLVEIAETGSDRSRGLQGRSELAENSGMAFVFDEPEHGPFTMDDTAIPLSIAFWDEDGRIVDILDMNPCRTDPCPLYESRSAFVGAVEVNQGFFRDHGVAVGDRVELEQPDGI